MTIILGVTVNWTLSPRIINMPAPFGEPTEPLTIEDLNDTLQYLEADEEGIAFPKLRDASGKEAGVVALTIQLLNAQIKFEDTGTPRVCKISGGNLFAVDENGDDMYPIAYNSNVTVGYAQSTAATMIAAVAEWTQTEKDSVSANIGDIHAKLPMSTIASDLDIAALDVIHGEGSWEGTPVEDILGKDISQYEAIENSLANLIKAIREKVKKQGAKF